MIRFLIHRPVAVTMTFVAIIILGTVAVFNIPVSLMPAIDVPQITVQISRKNTSARELENTVVAPLRQRLFQLGNLDDLSSETRDEQGHVTLRFDFGTNTDLAFIEVNEMIDRAMAHFPRDIDRPRAIKANVTDIPVFYLNITLKNESPDQDNTDERSTLFPVSQKFTELSEFASAVIKKRLEQLPDVAMVDVSGTVSSELLIMPDPQKMEAARITFDQLESHIRSKNVNLGNLLIHDGHYEYNIRFNSALRNKKDIEEIYLNIDGRLVQLRDLAEIVHHPRKRKGMVTADGQPAVTMAIIKQTEAQLGDLQVQLEEMIQSFLLDYPHLNFTVTRDQTKLLDYSISNLEQDLFWGGVLAFLVMFVFLRDIKSPLLIGITLPLSLIVSLIFFFLLDISINIISLSGLVLGVGMMIDNSIIVIDNIVQFRQRNFSLSESCIRGGSEVFMPMLSSALTTSAVFIPLIYLSGISGALFYDEAMSVVIGAFVSLLISVTLIPVYFKLFYRNEKPEAKNWLQRVNGLNYEAIYEKSFKFVLRHQKITWSIVIGVVALGGWAYREIPKSKLPMITKEDVILDLDWNEKINIEENNRRVKKMTGLLGGDLAHYTAWIGEQQFLLGAGYISASEASIYLKAVDENSLNVMQNRIADYLNTNFPEAGFTYRDADNIFNFIFSDNTPPLVAKLRETKNAGNQDKGILQKYINDIRKNIPQVSIQSTSFQEHIVLRADPLKMAVHDINPEFLYSKLKSAFNAREIFLVTNGQEFVPVILGDNKPEQISTILANVYVQNNQGILYPVRELVSQAFDYDLKTIIAGREGEYYPIALDVKDTEAAKVMDEIRSTLARDGLFEAGFDGSIFSNRKLIADLAIVLVVSVALLYIILAAQFESLTLPLIVLLEVPIDILAALIFLKIFGAGINLMSLIGLIVMAGIIINDSILKIDTINKLTREGHSVLKSILLGGQRRLKPILMTGLTTVLAMIPLLYTPGLGSELQKPLAVALLGGMTVGTLVSLYLIPLAYYYLFPNPGKKIAIVNS